MLSQALVDELNQIVLEESGVYLSPEESRELASMILDLYSLLLEETKEVSPND